MRCEWWMILVLGCSACFAACGGAAEMSSKGNNGGSAGAVGGDPGSGGSTPTSGGDSGSGGSAPAFGGTGAQTDGAVDPGPLLTQAPHCTGTEPELAFDGSIDGTPYHELRTSSTGGVNAGFVNGGKFDTPPEGSSPLLDSQMEMHFTWSRLLPDGSLTAIDGGTLVAPTGPHARQRLCITLGQVGFGVDGAEH